MSAFLSGAPLGWLGLLLLIAVSAVTVLGLCRAAGRADQTFEKAAARHFADQVEQDLADLTNHTPEEPQP